MKILVIKQTSLGDVLHSTGHVRAIKQHYPDSELHLLTATSSEPIYRHNPHVDHLILVDRYQVKANWWRRPGWSYQHMREVMRQVREHEYELAFDLQGLAKSVLFLYGARAKQKFVKGNWPGLIGFRKPQLHAIEEMDGVLALAGIENVNTAMEFSTADAQVQKVDGLLRSINPEQRPILLLSPFSRWPSKDWPLSHFVEVAKALEQRYLVLVTGAPDKQEEIASRFDTLQSDRIVNLAGQLGLLEFAELVKRAALMVTGDSFPMHMSVACQTPLLALFGPTDETRVGPRADNAKVLIAPDCNRCDRRDCQRQCLSRITPAQVIEQITRGG